MVAQYDITVYGSQVNFLNVRFFINVAPFSSRVLHNNLYFFVLNDKPFYARSHSISYFKPYLPAEKKYKVLSRSNVCLENKHDIDKIWNWCAWTFIGVCVSVGVGYEFCL